VITISIFVDVALCVFKFEEVIGHKPTLKEIQEALPKYSHKEIRDGLNKNLDLGAIIKEFNTEHDQYIFSVGYESKWTLYKLLKEQGYRLVKVQ
jgi:hypothetical protein